MIDISPVAGSVVLQDDEISQCRLAKYAQKHENLYPGRVVPRWVILWRAEWKRLDGVEGLGFPERLLKGLFAAYKRVTKRRGNVDAYDAYEHAKYRKLMEIIVGALATLGTFAPGDDVAAHLAVRTFIDAHLTLE